MAKTSIVDQIVQSLAFEVEAVPQNDSSKSTGTSNATPLNLKIRVRKTDTGVLEKAVLSVPKFGQPQAKPQRIKLVSSDQTIMSFNVSMEADLVKKQQRKHRRYFFGGCLGTQYDDDDSPYVPTVYSAKTTDRDSTSKSDGLLKQNFVLSKAKYNNTDSLQTYTKKYDILGKCKPGGCLDPPFGEEKYSYEPLKQKKRKVSITDKRAETTKNKQDHLLSSCADSKRSKEIVSVQKLSAKIEDDSILSLDDKNSLKDTLVSKYPDSVITYPPETSSSVTSNNKYLRTRVTSEEKQKKTPSESIPLDAFFPSPKKHNRFIEKHVNGKNFGKNGKSKAEPSITMKDNFDKKEGDIKSDKLSEITSSIERVDYKPTKTSSQQDLLSNTSNTKDSKTNKIFVTPFITKLPINEKEDIAVLSKNDILTSDQEVDLRSKDKISSVVKTVCDNDTTLRDLYLNNEIYAKSDDTIAISLTPEPKNTAINNDVSSAKDILPQKLNLKLEIDELANNFPITTFPSKKYSDENNLKDTIEKDSSITSLITQTSDNDLTINKDTSLSTQRVRTSQKASEIKTNLSINADASQINLDLNDVDSSSKFNNITTSVIEDQAKKDIEQNWSKTLEYNDKDNNSLKDSDNHLLSEKVKNKKNVSNVKKYLSTIQTPIDVVQGENSSESRTPTDNISQNVDPRKVTTATEGIHDIDILNNKNVLSSLQDDVTSPNDSSVVQVFPNVKDTDVLKNKGISSSIHDVESLPLATNVIPISPIENTKNDKSIEPEESYISTKPQSKTSSKNISSSEDSVSTAKHCVDSSDITAEYSSKPDSHKITDEMSDDLLKLDITQPFDDITSSRNDIITKNDDLVRRDSKYHKYRNENLQGEQDDNNTGRKNIYEENKIEKIDPNWSENSQYDTQDNKSLKDSNSYALNAKVQYEKKNSYSLLNVESTNQADVIPNTNDNYDLSLDNFTITNSIFNGNVPENGNFGSYLEPISLRDDDLKVKLSFPKNSIEYNNNTIDNYVDSDKFGDNSSTQKTITKDALRMGFNKESIKYINSSHKNENKSLKPNAVESPNSSENNNTESSNNRKIVNHNAEIGHKTNIKDKTKQNHEFMNSPLLLRQPVPAKFNSFEDKTILLRTLPELETITSGWDSKEGTYPTVRGSKSSLKRDAISLDFAFQTYVTDKKERTIKTVDIFNEPVRYPNDGVTVIQAQIRPLVNEIRIPVDSEYDMTIEIKRASSPTRRVQIVEEQQSGKSTRRKNVSRMQKENDNLINLDSCSGIFIKDMQDEFLNNKIQKQLNGIYDQQLMPLHSTIKNLKQDIDSLIQQQSLLGKKVRSGKTLKPPKLVRVNSRCGCSRK